MHRRIILIIFVLIAVLFLQEHFALHTAEAAFLFKTRIDYEAGSKPSSVAIEDLDRDGVPDLAVANEYSDNVSILLGNGDGTFKNAVNYSAGDGASSVAIGDLDGDGALDLAVANYNSDNVSILLGNGDGTFQIAVNYETGDRASSVAIGDLDGDGALDLAVANYYYYSDNVSILLGNGDGTFQSAVKYSAGDGVIFVAIGDLNGDDALDLAVANYFSDKVSILLGNGDGTFQSAVNYGTGDGASSVAIGDLNGDDVPDLAVANWGSDNVSILLGNGDGTFQSAVNYESGDGSFSIALADLDGDGALDLAVANIRSSNVAILLNNGDGAFHSAVYYGSGSEPYLIAVCDMDGNGAPDLAVANYWSDNVTVLLGNGDGTFLIAENYGAGNWPESVAIADLDGDGALDLAVANGVSDNVSIFLGNGDGTFRSAVNYGAGNRPSSVAIGDLDGDGAPDLAVTKSGSGNVSILLGKGDGTFQSAVNAVNYYVGDGTNSIAIADLDKDSAPDLAVTDPNWGSVFILLGNGDGTFQGWGYYRSFRVGDLPHSLALGHLDGDGAWDLAVANSGSDNVSILLGKGDGTFQSALNYHTGTGPQSVGIGDLNGDGTPDLAVSNGASDNVSILLGNGDGTFQSAVNHGTGDRPESAAIGDLNGDGALDLVVVNRYSDNISVFINVGPPYIIDVCPSGCRYKSIQVAIGEAADDDLIIVGDGIYNESINFKGKNLTVRSVNGPEVTHMNGRGSGSVVTFNSGESNSTTLEGFTITNGAATDGGGIFIASSSSPTIRRCIIKTNSAAQRGGGVYIEDSSPTLTNCLIFDNVASFGHGIFANRSSPKIVNSTITNNTYPHGEGIRANGLLSSPTLTNTILWKNGAEIHLENGSSINVEYSDVEEGYIGQGNINEDPGFFDPNNEDYHIATGSPCLDAGLSLDERNTDIDGDTRPKDSAYDIGADEFDQSPSAPTGLAGSQEGFRVNLSWTASPETDVHGYYIYRDGANINANLTKSTNYSNLVMSGKTYIYNVTAVDYGGNESAFSAPFSITTVSTAPVITDPNSGTFFLDLEISVRGNSEPGATIEIFVNGMSQGTTVATSTGYFSMSGVLISDGENAITARSTNSYGVTSAMSAAVVTQADPRPKVPESLVAESGDTTATISWDANPESDIQGYQIYRDGQRLNHELLTEVTFVDTRLTLIKQIERTFT